jgi:hypothetical protein
VVDIKIFFYNRVSVFREQLEVTNVDLVFFTDAAASIGKGTCMIGKWAQSRWEEHFKAGRTINSITFWEYFLILGGTAYFWGRS